MPKGPWEERVGMLLDSRQHPDFVYSFKPADSPFYGGQTRIDWHACDNLGRYWLIEVKQADSHARTFNVLREVSAGQQDGLDAVSRSLHGVALLAVGHEDVLSIFDWRELRWLREYPLATDILLERLPFPLATLSYRWTGKKSWSHNLFADLDEAQYSQPTLTRRLAQSTRPASSPLTSKPEDYTLMGGRRLSEQSFYDLVTKTLSSENSRSGGRKSSPRTPSKRSDTTSNST